jgi:hypothetical protein
MGPAFLGKSFATGLCHIITAKMKMCIPGIWGWDYIFVLCCASVMAGRFRLQTTEAERSRPSLNRTEKLTNCKKNENGNQNVLLQRLIVVKPEKGSNKKRMGMNT